MCWLDRGLEGGESSSEEDEDEEGWEEGLEGTGLEGNPAAALEEWGVGALAANPDEQVGGPGAPSWYLPSKMRLDGMPRNVQRGESIA